MTDAALVTASSSGLGASLSRFLAARGFTVFAHYRSSSEAVQRLEDEFGSAIVPLRADLTLSEERARLARTIDDHGASLRVLVNNLGIYTEQMLEDIDDQVFDRVFRATCTAGFDLVRRLRPRLEASAPSRVINIGDSGADRIEARRQATPYHIAKLGVHVLTRTWAQVLTPAGITVNMVSPGFLENSVGEPGEAIPAGRTGSFSDIEAAVAFLLSPEASYVSGTNIVVSGGWNLG